MKRIAVFALLVVAMASPAWAQSHPGASIFGTFDRVTVASPKTFDAVFGTHMLNAPGAGVDITDVVKHVFVRVGLSKASLDGERVVVFNGSAFPVGVNLVADMTTIEIGAGWRFAGKSGARVTPYAGGGLVLLKYKETSDFAESGENVDDSLNGGTVFGGVDFHITKTFFAGAEAQFRVVNAAPGPDSAAAAFNEKNLGGGVLRLRVGVRF